jgi:hypothetical protein
VFYIIPTNLSRGFYYRFGWSSCFWAGARLHLLPNKEQKYPAKQEQKYPAKQERAPEQAGFKF